MKWNSYSSWYVFFVDSQSAKATTLRQYRLWSDFAAPQTDRGVLLDAHVPFILEVRFMFLFF